MTEKIVIFEDEGVTALHLSNLLTSNGYAVPEVTDSADGAVEVVGAADADLVLMDIRLKGSMDGVDAATLIYEKLNIPVVIVSAHNDAATRRRIELSHAYGHVVKPFDDRDVIIAVRSTLHRRRLEKALAPGTGSQAPDLPQLGGAVVTTDVVGRVMYMNESAESLTGWKNADAFEHEATDVLRLVDTGSGSLIAHPVQSVLRGDDEPDRPHDSVLMSRTGARSSICYRVTPVEETSGDLCGTVVTIRRRRECSPGDVSASESADIDVSTGLATVEFLTDFLDGAIASARDRHMMVAVFHLDIDRPKTEVDSSLPWFGTDLIAAVEARLHESVRTSDAVARIDDTSFAVVQPRLGHASGAVTVGEKLVRIFREPLVVGNDAISVTASVGAALYPIDGEDASGLLKQAETVARRAKSGGRAQFRLFSDKAESGIAVERALTEDFDRAIVEDQYEMLFEPIFDLSSRAIVGAGTHLRWNHPEFGVMPASVFLPMAERHGVMASITGWVIRETLKWSVAWQAVTPGIRIAAPLTGSEIRRRSLVPQLINLLELCSAEARHLELEISEEVLVTEPPIITRLNLQHMSRLGVSLTLDKFGRAYASMLTLKDTPVHRVKIDESLVAIVTHDREAQAIVTTTIDLARSCGLQVAASGIETKDQWRWLRFHGCELGQGEFLAGCLRPQELFERLVEQND